ncbi:MAG TPA: hypothetical protein VFQ24_13430 [Terriglobia bacterium]|nr:hypothetical protein [Terriglobia bacterium]
MPRFRSVSAPLLVVAFAAFLFPVAAHATCYEPLCCTLPVTGTTHIESISPQVALPGVTVVYIKGYCFGDTQGTGSIKLVDPVTGNTQTTITDILFWTDAEIAFRVPFDAISDKLVVNSQSYGSDDTYKEANCPTPPPDYVGIYCGNDKINATFNIATVDPPVYTAAALKNMTAWPPEYVQGTWNYDDGDETMTLTLNQGPLNTTNGTWPITGSEVDNIWGQYNNVSGTLDQYGDLALCVAFGNQSPNGIEWLVLGSGDVTSQGLNYGVTCTPGTPPGSHAELYPFRHEREGGPLLLRNRTAAVQERDGYATERNGHSPVAVVDHRGVFAHCQGLGPHLSPFEQLRRRLHREICLRAVGWRRGE